MVAPLQARRGRERFRAGRAVERDKCVELGVRHRDGRDHLGIQLDRLRLQDCQNDVLDAGEKFWKRVARGRGVEQKLRVDDVLVAIGIKRENAHAAAKFEIDHVDGVADANDQVGSTEGAGDGGEFDALFEVVLGSGRIEERIHIGVSRPQGVLDIVARERVVIDRRANEIVERTFVLDQRAIAAWQRRAAIGIDGGLT